MGRELVGGHQLSVATFEAARGELGERSLIEVLAAMGYYLMIGLRADRHRHGAAGRSPTPPALNLKKGVTRFTARMRVSVVVCRWTQSHVAPDPGVRAQTRRHAGWTAAYVVHRCAWCKRVANGQGEFVSARELDPDAVVTDGMCPACAKREMALLHARRQAGEHLAA